MLETIPDQLAQVVSKRLSIPVIGIGAGVGCDGQIQVIHDILGLSQRRPKHAKLYADLNTVIGQALRAYAEEVRSGDFPTDEHAVAIDDAVLQELLGRVEGGVELDR